MSLVVGVGHVRALAQKPAYRGVECSYDIGGGPVCQGFLTLIIKLS
jgi:hypothetical protein